jgi:hypothetical protein
LELEGLLQEKKELVDDLQLEMENLKLELEDLKRRSTKTVTNTKNKNSYNINSKQHCLGLGLGMGMGLFTSRLSSSDSEDSSASNASSSSAPLLKSSAPLLKMTNTSQSMGSGGRVSAGSPSVDSGFEESGDGGRDVEIEFEDDSTYEISGNTSGEGRQQEGKKEEEKEEDETLRAQRYFYKRFGVSIGGFEGETGSEDEDELEDENTVLKDDGEDGDDDDDEMEDETEKLVCGEGKFKSISFFSLALLRAV